MSVANDGKQKGRFRNEAYQNRKKRKKEKNGRYVEHKTLYRAQAEMKKRMRTKHMPSV